MPFNYTTFRAEYIRLLAEQRARQQAQRWAAFSRGFHYPTFRAEYIRLLRQQYALDARDDARLANIEYIMRPTELMVSARMHAEHQRQRLSEAELRVLYYDKRFMREAYEPDDLTLETRRCTFIAMQTGLTVAQVERTLDAIDRVFAHNIVLDRIPDETYHPRTCRQRHRRGLHRRKRSPTPRKHP